MKIYLVGGAVRDKLLGIQSNDLDYVMVIDKEKVFGHTGNVTPAMGYATMKLWMEKEGFEIFLETAEMFTIRAKFPKNHKHAGTVADFVLARKEVGYEPGSRRPILELGTLEDDLMRRDFTVNAMAEDEDGNLIDLHNGHADLLTMTLRTPLDPEVTFKDDPLRVLRALRFAITKNMSISYPLKDAMRNPFILRKLKEVVSQERIREELMKMLKHDTVRTLKVLHDYDEKYLRGILDICFGGEMWLKPTTEKR